MSSIRVTFCINNPFFFFFWYALSCLSRTRPDLLDTSYLLTCLDFKVFMRNYTSFPFLMTPLLLLTNTTLHMPRWVSLLIHLSMCLRKYLMTSYLNHKLIQFSETFFFYFF